MAVRRGGERGWSEAGETLRTERSKKREKEGEMEDKHPDEDWDGFRDR